MNAEAERLWLAIARLTQLLEGEIEKLIGELKEAVQSFREASTQTAEALAKARLTANRETRLTRFPPISVEAPPSFSDINDVPKRALVDADRHVQADILSMPPVSVTVTEKGFSNAADVPTRALVDADRHVQVDVLSLANPPNLDVPLSTRASETSLTRTDVESEAGVYSKRVDIRYDNVGLAKEATLAGIKAQTDKLQFDVNNFLKTVPQATPNPPNLDVALSTRASEATLTAIKNALASVGTDKLRTSLVDALPEGTNKIGSVDAYKAGTWNIDNLFNPHPVDVFRQGNVVHFNLTFTAAGTQTVYTPSTGKKAQIIGFFMEGTADVEAVLRFAVSGNVVAALPAKGVCAMNLIGLYPPTGTADEAVQVYASGATSVRGWICVVEV